MLKGAIFDWDGVVIDSSAHHEKSWEALAAEEKLTLPPDHFVRGFGMVNRVIIPNLLKWTSDEAEITRLGERKEELYREIVQREGLQPLPGVRTLLENLKAADIRCAIGSSTPRSNLETILPMLGLEEFFTAIVTGDDVKHGKPDPEVFLLAAEKIGCAPAESVVFEDAHVGIEAALAGKFTTVAVATTNPINQLGKAHLAVESLESVSIKQLRSLIQ